MLLPQEARLLTIGRSSLDDAERLHLQSHVEHAQNFQRQIPRTAEILLVLFRDAEIFRRVAKKPSR